MAKDYLKYIPFSYKGLVSQLEYKSFSNEDAVFAVENCGADWKEQAGYTAFIYQIPVNLIVKVF